MKKVAQLAQKLYNLTLLEDTLNTRLKMGQTFDGSGSGPAPTEKRHKPMTMTN